MAFFELNEWGIDIADLQASQKISALGSNKYSLGGNFGAYERKQKRIWTVTTNYLTEEEADAVEGIVLGLGDSCSFEERDGYGKLNTDRGMNPELLNHLNTVPQDRFNTSNAIIGSISFKLTVSATDILEYDFTDIISNKDYTVMVFHKDDTTGTISHVALVYDYDTTTTTKYIDGSTTSDTIYAITMSSNTVQLRGKRLTVDSPRIAYFDNLAVLPYKAPASLINAIYSARTDSGRGWGRNPFVNLGGDIIKPDYVIECKGKILNQQYYQCAPDGTFVDNARVIQFELEEI